MTFKTNSFALLISIQLNEEISLSELTGETDYDVVDENGLIIQTELLGEQDENVVAINVKLSKELSEEEISQFIKTVQCDFEHDCVDRVKVFDYSLKPAV